MSKPVNPTLIGGFLVGGLALLVLALLVFGSGQMFKPKMYWVVYFDSSLNGLNVGAPVKVQGVQVGVVKSINLQLDRDHKRLMKPVVLEIEPSRLANPDGAPIDLTKINLDRRKIELEQLIEAGLRARLEVQSLLTGLLFVDIDFHPEQPPRLTGLAFEGAAEVPSIPPTVDEVLGSVENIIKKLGQLPLESMAQDLAGSLAELHRLVGSEDARKSQQALAKSVESAQRILAEVEKRLPGLMSNLSVAGEDVAAAAHAMKSHAKPMMVAAENTFKSTQEAAENVADVTSDDAALESTLVALERAARSIRNLTDYLERHPDSLLFGKKP